MEGVSKTHPHTRSYDTHSALIHMKIPTGGGTGHNSLNIHS